MVHIKIRKKVIGEDLFLPRKIDTDSKSNPSHTNTQSPASINNKNTFVEYVENLILEFFLTRNNYVANYENLNSYFKLYGFPELTKHELINIIRNLGIFTRIGKSKGHDVIVVSKSKVRYRCNKRGIDRRVLDRFGNPKITGLKDTGYRKFGIGIGNQLKSTDPYRSVHWKTFPGYIFNPYIDKIEVSKRSGNTWQKVTPISPGGRFGYNRDLTDYKSMIWAIMHGLSPTQLGTTIFYSHFHSNKSFYNKHDRYLPELEDAIYALRSSGWVIGTYDKKRAVELLAKYDMQLFQGIRNSIKCGELRTKNYSPIVNASFIIFILEIQGNPVPNTRQCKFLRSIGWSLCRYNMIKKILVRGNS